VIVPGNHERSALPFPLLWSLPNLYVFDSPRTFLLTLRGYRVALSGFPYSRDDQRRSFSETVASTGWQEHRADIRLLCIHQIVEGAAVGSQNFIFRHGADVIPSRLLPCSFAAVLTGHVHRFQVLSVGSDGSRAASPVFYSGSTERTSFAECDEQKGYLLLDAVPTACGKGTIHSWCFEPLPSRPMKTIDVPVDGLDAREVRHRIAHSLKAIDSESIVRLRIYGNPEADVLQSLSARVLRSLAPPTMNIELRWPRPAQ
jgi:DNA repair exonuclease SbcCD nuclease subunit